MFLTCENIQLGSYLATVVTHIDNFDGENVNYDCRLNGHLRTQRESSFLALYKVLKLCRPNESRGGQQPRLGIL